MTKLLTRSRFAVGLASLLFALTTTAAIAELPNQTANPDGGFQYNAGAVPPNSKTTDGNATGGSVQQNSDGTTANANMSYNTPNDGSSYNGTYTVTTYDSNGNQIAQATSTVSDFGNGGGMVVGYGAITLPPGGMVVIRLFESNGSGVTFTAGFRLRNFRP